MSAGARGLSLTPAPGWKHALNAAHFKVGRVFGWHEFGKLWAGRVVEVDVRACRVKVDSVHPAVIADAN